MNCELACTGYKLRFDLLNLAEVLRSTTHKSEQLIAKCELAVRVSNYSVSIVDNYLKFH